VEITGLRVAVDAGPAQTGSQQYNAAVTSMGSTARSVTQQIKTYFGTAGAEIKTFAGTVREQFARVREGVLGLRELLAGAALGYGLEKVNEHLARLSQINRAMTVGAGGAGMAAVTIRQLREETEKLGLDFDDIGLSFAKFLSATRDTALQGERTTEIFKGLAAGIRAAGGGSDELNTAMEKVTGILSMAKVQGSMMVRQLKQEFPGVFRDMAQAMGMSRDQLTTELDRMSIGSEELITRWATFMQSKYQEATMSAANTMSAWKTRLRDTKNELIEVFATGGYGTAMIDLLRTMVDIMKDPEVRAFAGWLGGALATAIRMVGDLMKFLSHHTGEVKTLLTAFVAGQIGSKLFLMGSALWDMGKAAWELSKALAAAGTAQEALGAVSAMRAGAGVAAGFGSKAVGGFLGGVAGAGAAEGGAAALVGGAAIGTVAAVVVAVISALGLGYALYKAQSMGKGTNDDAESMLKYQMFLNALGQKAGLPELFSLETPMNLQTMNAAVAQRSNATVPPPSFAMDKTGGNTPFRNRPDPRLLLQLSQMRTEAEFAEKMSKAQETGTGIVSLQAQKDAEIQIQKLREQGLTKEQEGLVRSLIARKAQAEQLGEVNKFYRTNSMETEFNTETQRGLLDVIKQGPAAVEAYNKHRELELTLLKQGEGLTGKAATRWHEYSMKLLSADDALQAWIADAQRAQAVQNKVDEVLLQSRGLKEMITAQRVSNDAVREATALDEANQFARENKIAIGSQEYQQVLQLIQARMRLNEIQQTANQIIQQFDPERAYLDRIAAIQAAWMADAISTEQASRAVQDAKEQYDKALEEMWLKTKTVKGGIAAAMHEIGRESKDMATAVYNAVKNLYEGLSDRLATFLETGHAKFTDVFKSFAHEIETALVKKYITGPLFGKIGAALGIPGLGQEAPKGTQTDPIYVRSADPTAGLFGGGGEDGSQSGGIFGKIFGWLGGLLGSMGGGGGLTTTSGGGWDTTPPFGGGDMPVNAAYGGVMRFTNGGIRAGVTRRPTLFMTSEFDHAEAVVPLPDGNSIPVSMNGQRSQPQNVSVRVINQSSQAVQGKKGPTAWDPTLKEMVTTIYLEDADGGGPMSKLRSAERG
jgi:tape measure domain-containing protein